MVSAQCRVPIVFSCRVMSVGNSKLEVVIFTLSPTLSRRGRESLDRLCSPTSTMPVNLLVHHITYLGLAIEH